MNVTLGFAVVIFFVNKEYEFDHSEHKMNIKLVRKHHKTLLLMVFLFCVTKSPPYS